MRRALTKLLPEDHPSIEKRSCKRRDSNERPKYQNVRVSFSSAAFSFDSVLAVGGAAHRRSGWLRLGSAFICHFLLRKWRNEVPGQNSGGRKTRGIVRIHEHHGRQRIRKNKHKII